MTLTEIINADEKKMSADEKVSAITEIVEKARKAYGNEGVDIEAPEIDTFDGKVNLKYLSNSDKVAVAGNAIRSIRAQAIQTTESTEGTVLDKEVERLISTNPVLCNLATTSDSAYI